MPNVTFLPWNRSDVYDLASVPSGAFVRLRGRLDFTATDTMPGTAQAPVGGGIDFEILGPTEVEGMRPGAIAKTFPARSAQNCETTKMCYVEFAEEDIPWRYTAELAAGVASRRLAPWCVLVVGRDDQVVRGENNTVKIAQAVLQEHDLAQSARWAHIQDGAPRIARILSPAALQPFTKYRAAVVPAFKVAGIGAAAQVVRAWQAGDAQITLRAFDTWEFETGSNDDFRALAAKLKPSPASQDLGRAPLAYERTDPRHDLQFRGCLAPIGGSDAVLPPEVSADLQDLMQTEPDLLGRKVIGAPVYGGSWKSNPMATDWASELNLDPRHRGAAGLGLESAITMQEEIMRAATEQFGALDIAAQYVRYLVLGLEASRRLWQNRLPTDPAHRLQIFWPSLLRMRTATGSVRDAIAGEGRPLPHNLFSSAARRILRQGPARTRVAAPSATDPGAILRRANRCPSPAPLAPAGLPHAEVASRRLANDSITHHGLEAAQSGALRGERFLQYLLKLAENGLAEFGLRQNTIDAFRKLVDEARSRYRATGHLAYREFAELLSVGKRRITDREFLSRIRRFDHSPNEVPTPNVEDLIALVRWVFKKPRPRDCQPVRLDEVIDSVAAAIDPTVDEPPAKVRVLGKIDGLDDQPLAPPEICVGLDMPMWRYLRDHAPDLLLPGASTIADNAAHALETNPNFVEAFLIGANRQTVDELRWRNTPIAAGCTPLRVFWDRIDYGGDQRIDDIRGVANWPDASSLAADSHRPAGVGAVNLVFVFRSQLFLRYPETLVSLVPASLDENGNVDWEQDPNPDASRVLPAFQGRLGRDITFFGFEILPAAGRDKWLVLEEPPPGYMFRRMNAAATEGAEFAATTLERPTIAVLRGTSMIPEV